MHGDDTYMYPTVTMNFSSNIYVHADLSMLTEHLNSCIGKIASYPEPEPWTLEGLIAEKEGIGTECVMVGSGATELIYIIAAMMQGGTYTLHHPTFSEYDRACRLHNMLMPYRADHHDMEWICNPNNPDGSVWQKDSLLRHIDSNPGTVFVIDASYEDYTPAPLPSTEELLQRHNVIALHSMTKRYCIPGLRLGYAIAQQQMISRMKKHQQTWSVNTLAQEAGIFLLKNNIWVLPPINEYMQEAKRLATAINSVEGYKAEMRDTTFFLCTTCGNAKEMKEWLAREKGILIRDASNFPTLSPHHFRIATQKQEENDMLIDLLNLVHSS